MKLYFSPGACSLSPHIVAREADLPVELSRVTFSAEGRTTAEGEDFFVVNPKGGYIPALRLDEGEVISEGPAIVQYLADQAPDKKLTPERGSLDYYRMLEWLTFISTEIHKGFSPLYRQDLPETERTAVIDKLKKRYSYVEGALAGKTYVVGETFSLADAYLYTIMRWSPRANIAFSEYPNIETFMKLMETRPAVLKALEEEGIEKLV